MVEDSAKDSSGRISAAWMPSEVPVVISADSPDKLAPAEKERLFAACDQHLERVVEALAPKWVVGIGAFAEGRAEAVLGGREIQIGRILHPSPANPRAQRDWAGTVRRELEALGICRRGDRA